MEIKLDVIINVMIGLFIYNAIIKSFAMSVLKVVFNSESAKPSKDSFKDAMAAKLNEVKNR